MSENSEKSAEQTERAAMERARAMETMRLRTEDQTGKDLVSARRFIKSFFAKSILKLILNDSAFCLKDVPLYRKFTSQAFDDGRINYEEYVVLDNIIGTSADRVSFIDPADRKLIEEVLGITSSSVIEILEETPSDGSSDGSNEVYEAVGQN